MEHLKTGMILFRFSKYYEKQEIGRSFKLPNLNFLILLPMIFSPPKMITHLVHFLGKYIQKKRKTQKALYNI